MYVREGKFIDLELKKQNSFITQIYSHIFVCRETTNIVNKYDKNLFRILFENKMSRVIILQSFVFNIAGGIA